MLELKSVSQKCLLYGWRGKFLFFFFLNSENHVSILSVSFEIVQAFSIRQIGSI